jgi:hypothetical protein
VKFLLVTGREPKLNEFFENQEVGQGPGDWIDGAGHSAKIRITDEGRNVIHGGKSALVTISARGGFVDRKFSAFGDSITRGTGYGDLAADGSDAYINQYAAAYDFVTDWTRNEDGGGRFGVLKWAIEELPERIKGMDYAVLAFGVHNAKRYDEYGVPILPVFMEQYRQLIRRTKELGAEPIGWVMTRRGDVDLATQRAWAKAQERICIAEGIRYVNAWDALDLSPFDDAYQDQDTRQYHTDLVHPIAAGQAKLAEAVARAFGYIG